MEYTPKTPEQIKELATDLQRGLIYTSWHAYRTNESLGMIFMILGLMPKADIDALVKILGERGMVYEYLDKANRWR